MYRLHNFNVRVPEHGSLGTRLVQTWFPWPSITSINALAGNEAIVCWVQSLDPGFPFRILIVSQFWRKIFQSFWRQNLDWNSPKLRDRIQNGKSGSAAICHLPINFPTIPMIKTISAYVLPTDVCYL